MQYLKLSFQAVKKIALSALLFFSISHSANANETTTMGITAEQIVNKLTQHVATTVNTGTSITWPEIQKQILTTKIIESILEPPQPTSFILNTDFEQEIAATQHNETTATGITAEQIVNKLAQRFATSVNTSTSNTWPDIQKQILTTKIIESILEPPQPISFILNTDFEQEIAATPHKEISYKLTCEHLHDDLCMSLTIE